LGETTADSATGLAYDKQKELAYVVENGKIYSWNQEQGFKQISYMPIYDASWNRQRGFLLEGDLLAVQDNEQVYVRTVDPDLVTDQVLTIGGGNSWNEEIRAFQKVEPGIPLSFIEGGWNEIAQKMMLGDGEADLYYVQLSAGEYETLLEKNYVVDLSNSDILVNAVNEMYPVVQEAVKKDGKLVAFPADLQISTMGYADAIGEEIGIDRPTTWEEVMEIYKQWEQQYGDEYSQYYLSEVSYNEEGGFSQQMFSDAMMGYVFQQEATEGKIRFNTDAFRSLIQKYEEVKPYTDQIFDEENARYYEGEGPFSLFNPYFEVTPRSYSGERGFTPLLLTVGEESQSFSKAFLSVYVINPHSSNQEMAIKFLETIAQNLPRELSISLNPKDNEPVVDEHMKEFMDEEKEQLEKLKAEEETIDESEKQNYEEMIKEKESFIKEVEERSGMWVISPEQIAQYRAFDGQWTIMMKHPFSSPELYEVALNYVHGGISSEEMISTLDSRIGMLELEGR
ncbi:MAG: extracellular solute-binding protein, partial [Clostridiales bacterium]|nr:extracellular solute-binding protein [Clostridiales bacterium]